MKRNDPIEERRWLGPLVMGAALFLPPWAEAYGASFRYASSSNRIYVESGGSATLSDIKNALPSAPLDLVSATGKLWLLRANLIVEDGAALVLHGSGIGGDVNELRLQSNNASTAGSIVYISAEHGTLDIEATKITSWNTAAGAADTEVATYGRAFIRVRSRLASDGVTPLESRMDVIDSEIAYLGYNASESYGLVWKVIGSASDLFDRVQVRGNIINSRIHHNYFGVYTYGHQDGLWRDNQVYNNVQYGFDPHDDSDNLLIENNDVHHNGNHGIIASKRCDHVVIRNNRSWSNTGNGIMLHRSSNDGLVEDNQAHDNGDSGVAIFATARTTIRNNLLLNNGKSGMRFSMGAADSVVENNAIGDSGKYGFYFYKGSDTPEPGDDGRPKRNVFSGNHVYGSALEGIKMSDGDGNRFVGNRFENNGLRFRLTTSTQTEFNGNTIPPNVVVTQAGSSAIRTDAVFRAQPLIKLALTDSYSTATFRAGDNAVFDPDESIDTAVTPSESSMSLSRSQIGSSTTVYTRNLFVRLASATVYVNPTFWNTGTETGKGWRARSSSSAQSVQYEVGDLTPGAQYAAYQGSTQIGVFSADAAGRIAFSVVPGTTATLSYSVNKL